ncbi:agmatinase family protein [Prochlorothrix hollandica]|uniref:agmatinase family protein n=1 Tax=Prochlorothrix hollandica TaxID=1223 RepID=UPI003341385C
MVSSSNALSSDDRPNTDDRLSTYDPNGVGLDNGNLFGFPFTEDSAQTWILPVPWDVTTSYRPGTAAGPQAVLEASPQLDFFDLTDPQGWRRGIFMPPISQSWLDRNRQLRTLADGIIQHLEQGHSLAHSPDLLGDLATINESCAHLNQWVYGFCTDALDRGKTVGILGGDHSVPLGYLQALADRYPDFGILHIDAHADLRHCYDGFTFSHASIMDNALQLPPISKLVQVGIRDLCQAEADTIAAQPQRIVTHYDRRLKQALYQGHTWETLCQRIIADLPPQVYISFDIDGLDPQLCPETGTPVPGGLSWDQTLFLLQVLGDSDRQIIGFDLCEVGNAPWDGNVGARVLYQLALLASRSPAPR